MTSLCNIVHLTEIPFHRVDDLNSPIVQKYVLPDMSTNKTGHILGPNDMTLDSEQVIIMKNERFSVPEIVFRPDDIGN